MAKTTAGLFDSPKSPFHFLGPVVLKEIESHVKVFQLKKKQSVYQEGIKPSGLFYLRKGKVKISKSTDNGKEVILYIAKENDLLGYI